MRWRFLAAGNAGARAYGAALTRCLRAPLVTLGVGLAVAALVGSLSTSLDREPVPEENRGQIIVWLKGPDGLNLDYSDRQVTKVENILQPLVENGTATGIL